MTLATQKQEVYDYVNTFLGGGMVDVELDPIHYQTGLKKALTRYRMRSDHAVEESYMFLTTVIDQNDYVLPNEVMEVRKCIVAVLGHVQAVDQVVVYLNRLTLHTQTHICCQDQS